MSKTQLGIVFGGMSSEHEISCISAASVIRSLNKDKYDIHMIGINRDGKWLLFDGSVDDIEMGTWESGNVIPAFIPPSRDIGGVVSLDDSSKMIVLDAVFPVLHGKWGEDGTIQGLFELAGIPCVGSSVIGSAVCMDKCITKTIISAEGIPQTDWTQIKRGENADIAMIEKKIGYPCFIKPANAGSSVGISKAEDREQLILGIKTAFREDYKVLIEEGIDAREIECSVIGNLNPEAAPVIGEIVPSKDFYDYEAKYNDKSSKLLIPAPVDNDTREKITNYAVRAYKACECRGLARVDFFVDRSDGRIILNEINTIPGFTSISMYPKLWEASGMSYSMLIDKLIDYALA